MTSGALAELRNIAANTPCDPGDTLMGSTAHELVKLGFVRRHRNGTYVVTLSGLQELSRQSLLPAEKP